MSDSITKPAVFDVDRPISVKADVGGNIRRIGLRFPSDNEWVERARAQKFVFKQLGRQREQMTVPQAAESNKALLLAIAGEGEALDAILPAEAARIIDALSRAEVTDVEETGSGFRVQLAVPGGEVWHQVDRPDAAQVEAFEKASATRVKLPFDRVEVTLNIRAAEDLYHELHGTVKDSDYAGGKVPLPHKMAVVQGAIKAYRTLLEDDDPNS